MSLCVCGVGLLYFGNIFTKHLVLAIYAAFGHLLTVLVQDRLRFEKRVSLKLDSSIASLNKTSKKIFDSTKVIQTFKSSPGVLKSIECLGAIDNKVNVVRRHLQAIKVNYDI